MKRHPASTPTPDPASASDVSLSRRALLKMGVVTLAAAGFTAPAAPAPPRPGGTPLGFCPITGLPGDSLKLFGPDFGATLPDLSVRLVNGSAVGFALPQAFSGDELEVGITAVPRTMQEGVFQVVWGTGYYTTPNNLPAQLTLTEPIRTWLGTGGDRCDSFQYFSFPWYNAGSPGCLSYWGGVAGGKLSIVLEVPFDEDCCPACPAGTRMTLRLYGTTAGATFECEYQATLISTTKLYATHIADALCTVFQSAFNSDFGVVPTCTQTDIDDTRVVLTIGTPSGTPFTLGAVHIELRHDQGSLPDDSMACDSMSSNCDSIDPSCPSINVDFMPFIFS